MRKLLLIAAAVTASMSLTAKANELDNETTVTTEQVQLSQALPKTVVVRTKLDTGAVEVMHSNDQLGTDELTKAIVAGGAFTQVDANSGKTPSELDIDTSNSSWYFCFPSYNYYRPTYYYYSYTYTYTSYYTYSYSGYSYSYYSWPKSCGWSWGYCY